jgi:hypothetical protein
MIPKIVSFGPNSLGDGTVLLCNAKIRKYPSVESLHTRMPLRLAFSILFGFVPIDIAKNYARISRYLLPEFITLNRPETVAKYILMLIDYVTCDLKAPTF